MNYKILGGSEEDIQDAIQAKQALFKKIVGAIKATNLAPKGITDSSTPEEVAEMFKRSSVSDRATDERLNKEAAALARAINEAFGQQFIDAEGNAKYIFAEAAIIIASLGKDMHIEFLAILQDAKELLNEIDILANSISALLDEDSKTDATKKLAKDLKGAIELRVNALRVLLSSISPMSEKFREIEEKHKMLTEFARDLKANMEGVSSRELVNRIYATVAMTIGLTAEAKKALHAIKVSEEAFKGMSAAEFERAIVESREKFSPEVFTGLEQLQNIIKYRKTKGGAPTEISSIEKQVRLDSMRRKMEIAREAGKINLVFKELAAALDKLANKISGKDIGELREFWVVVQEVIDVLTNSETNIFVYRFSPSYQKELLEYRETQLVADCKFIGTLANKFTGEQYKNEVMALVPIFRKIAEITKEFISALNLKSTVVSSSGLAELVQIIGDGVYAIDQAKIKIDKKIKYGQFLRSIEQGAVDLDKYVGDYHELQKKTMMETKNALEEQLKADKDILKSDLNSLFVDTAKNELRNGIIPPALTIFDALAPATPGASAYMADAGINAFVAKVKSNEKIYEKILTENYDFENDIIDLEYALEDYIFNFVNNVDLSTNNTERMLNIFIKSRLIDVKTNTIDERINAFNDKTFGDGKIIKNNRNAVIVFDQETYKQYEDLKSALVEFLNTQMVEIKNFIAAFVTIGKTSSPFMTPKKFYTTLVRCMAYALISSYDTGNAVSKYMFKTLDTAILGANNLSNAKLERVKGLFKIIIQKIRDALGIIKYTVGNTEADAVSPETLMSLRMTFGGAELINTDYLKMYFCIINSALLYSQQVNTLADISAASGYKIVLLLRDSNPFKTFLKIIFKDSFSIDVLRRAIIELNTLYTGEDNPLKLPTFLEKFIRIVKESLVIMNIDKLKKYQDKINPPESLKESAPSLISSFDILSDDISGLFDTDKEDIEPETEDYNAIKVKISEFITTQKAILTEINKGAGGLNREINTETEKTRMQLMNTDSEYEKLKVLSAFIMRKESGGGLLDYFLNDIIVAPVAMMNDISDRIGKDLTPEMNIDNATAANIMPNAEDNSPDFNFGITSPKYFIDTARAALNAVGPSVPSQNLKVLKQFIINTETFAATYKYLVEPLATRDIGVSYNISGNNMEIKFDTSRQIDDVKEILSNASILLSKTTKGSADITKIIDEGVRGVTGKLKNFKITLPIKDINDTSTLSHENLDFNIMTVSDINAPQNVGSGGTTMPLGDTLASLIYGTANKMFKIDIGKSNAIKELCEIPNNAAGLVNRAYVFSETIASTDMKNKIWAKTGLTQKFNILIMDMIFNLSDRGNNIYSKLLEPLLMSPLSTAIYDKSLCINDLNPNNINNPDSYGIANLFTRINSPEYGYLLQSVGQLIYYLATKKEKQTLKYTIGNAFDLPVDIQYKIKTRLPQYNNTIRNLIKIINLYMRLIDENINFDNSFQQNSMIGYFVNSGIDSVINTVAVPAVPGTNIQLGKNNNAYPSQGLTVSRQIQATVQSTRDGAEIKQSMRGVLSSMKTTLRLMLNTYESIVEEFSYKLKYMDNSFGFIDRKLKDQASYVTPLFLAFMAPTNTIISAGDITSMNLAQCFAPLLIDNSEFPAFDNEITLINKENREQISQAEIKRFVARFSSLYALFIGLNNARQGLVTYARPRYDGSKQLTIGDVNEMLDSGVYTIIKAIGESKVAALSEVAGVSPEMLIPFSIYNIAPFNISALMRSYALIYSQIMLAGTDLTAPDVVAADNTFTAFMKILVSEYKNIKEEIQKTYTLRINVGTPMVIGGSDDDIEMFDPRKTPGIENIKPYDRELFIYSNYSKNEFNEHLLSPVVMAAIGLPEYKKIGDLAKLGDFNAWLTRYITDNKSKIYETPGMLGYIYYLQKIANYLEYIKRLENKFGKLNIAKYGRIPEIGRYTIYDELFRLTREPKSLLFSDNIPDPGGFDAYYNGLNINCDNGLRTFILTVGHPDDLIKKNLVITETSLLGKTYVGQFSAFRMIFSYYTAFDFADTLFVNDRVNAGGAGMSAQYELKFDLFKAQTQLPVIFNLLYGTGAIADTPVNADKRSATTIIPDKNNTFSNLGTSRATMVSAPDSINISNSTVDDPFKFSINDTVFTGSNNKNPSENYTVIINPSNPLSYIYGVLTESIAFRHLMIDGIANRVKDGIQKLIDAGHLTYPHVDIPAIFADAAKARVFDNKLTKHAEFYAAFRPEFIRYFGDWNPAAGGAWATPPEIIQDPINGVQDTRAGSNASADATEGPKITAMTNSYTSGDSAEKKKADMMANEYGINELAKKKLFWSIMAGYGRIIGKGINRCQELCGELLTIDRLPDINNFLRAYLGKYGDYALRQTSTKYESILLEIMRGNASVAQISQNTADNTLKNVDLSQNIVANMTNEMNNALNARAAAPSNTNVIRIPFGFLSAK